MQAVQAKREFNERAKENDYEQKHDNAYQYWYNRLRQLKRAKTPDVDKIKTVSEAFKVFKKEAVKYKSMVKLDKTKEKEFTTWLLKQQIVVDKLMDE